MLSRKVFVVIVANLLSFVTIVTAADQAVVCTGITDYSCAYFESSTASSCFNSNQCDDVGGDFECPDGVYNYSVNGPLVVSGNFAAGPGQSGNSSYSKTPVVCVVRQPCTDCVTHAGRAGKWCFSGSEPYSDFRTYELWTATGEPCTGGTPFP